MAAALHRGDATQRSSTTNNAMTVDACVIGHDQGIDLRPDPRSVLNGRGRDPDHEIGSRHGRRARGFFEESTEMKSKSMAGLLALSLAVSIGASALASQVSHPV
jgi:hypothetical protein